MALENAYSDYVDNVLLGASGIQNFDSARLIQHLREIGWITFQNMTLDIVNIYPIATNVAAASLAATAPLFRIGPMTTITTQFINKMREGFLIQYQCTEPSYYAVPQTFRTLMNSENPNMNFSQASAFQSIAPANNVDIVGNSIGLALAAQLPLVLTAGGNLKVAILENTTLADTNNYVVNPMTIGSTNASIDLTQAGVAGKNWCIGYANWRIEGAATGASAINVQILDNTTVIYQSSIPPASAVGANLQITFPQPIKITAGNAIHYKIGASGAAGSVVRANAGFLLK